MPNLLTKFTHYLTTFGLCTENTIPQLHQTFTEIHSTKSSTNTTNLTSFKETMLSTLIHYLSSLTETSKHEIGLSLITNFFSLTTTFKLSKLKTCILLCNAKYTTQLISSFLKWKHLSSKPSSSFKQHCTKYNKVFHLETSHDKREKEELTECTFHPNTTFSNSYHRALTTSNNDITSSSVYERLYKDSAKYETKRQMKQIEAEHMLSSKYNFKPELTSTPKNFRNRSEVNFNERQKSFITKQAHNKQKLQHIIDEVYNTKCSFSPKININSSKHKSHLQLTNSNNVSTQPAYIRLYEDDKTRRMKTNKKIKELNQQIDDNCNSFISKRLITSSTTYNNDTQQQCVSMSNTNNNFDSNKIEQLYQQYKKRPAKIQKIKQTADIESGITFEPHVNRNSKYYDKINTNVIERTERTIEHKKKFVNDVNKAEEQLRKEQQYGYKKYTQNEKEEITQRIIHRLYGRGYLKCNYAKKANGNYSPIEMDDNEQYNYMDSGSNNNVNSERYEMNVDDEGIISNGMGDV